MKPNKSPVFNPASLLALAFVILTLVGVFALWALLAEPSMPTERRVSIAEPPVRMSFQEIDPAAREAAKTAAVEAAAKRFFSAIVVEAASAEMEWIYRTQTTRETTAGKAAVAAMEYRDRKAAHAAATAEADRCEKSLREAEGRFGKFMFCSQLFRFRLAAKSALSEVNGAWEMIPLAAELEQALGNRTDAAESRARARFSEAFDRLKFYSTDATFEQAMATESPKSNP